MSGLDPLAAYALQAVANAQAAIEESTLNLGTLLADFQAQVSVGDVLSATVLPPQNGSDRISLLGQTITAQLPPGINPGETIALQVTGFTNTAIIVKNLGPVDPEAPLPQPETPPQTLPGQPQTAILKSVPPETAGTPVTPPPPRPIQPPPPVARQPQAPAVAPRVAPPREIFVAASVRPSQTPVAGTSVDRDVAPSASSQPDLEARIAATRASTTIGSPAKTAATPAQTPAQNAARAGVPSPAQSAAAQAAVARASVERALVASQTRVASPLQTPAAPTPQTPEALLLARLRVPLSTTTLAAARLIEVATRSVTSAYEKLDALLGKLPLDERTSTLRSTLAFVGKFDLRNARALPEQIASFVSNVVTGPESKIAQIVRLWSEALAQELPAQSETPPQAPPGAPPGETASARTLLPSVPAVPASPALQPQAASVARAAERGVALEYDVKSSLLQLVANPPQGSAPQLIAALRDALTATTAVQLNALNAQNGNPNTITIPLPAYFYEGGQPAHLQISRDSSRGKNTMDADNFHIAFVLDTKSLGTVAIDVQTVGRSVSVDVKTETPRSADRFRTSLEDLRLRLEGLHYRVATMAAGLAARGASPVKEPTAPGEPMDRTSNVDMQA